MNAEHVYMKIFKDIPRADVDMLLPGARVTLKFLDRGKIGVGLLSGGYGLDELQQSGAFRVYEDPADMLRHIDEVGGRR